MAGGKKIGVANCLGLDIRHGPPIEGHPLPPTPASEAHHLGLEHHLPVGPDIENLDNEESEIQTSTKGKQAMQYSTSKSSKVASQQVAKTDTSAQSKGTST